MYDNWYTHNDYDYLMHYGVKGMKWGHRKRYYDSSGNLNARGIKKYATKGYSQDSYNSNKTGAGKVYDKVTGAHKYGGKMLYNMSSQKANKARAEQYVADQKAKKEAANTPEAKAARRKKALKVGAAVAGTALAAYGAYKLNDYVKTKNGQIAAERGYDKAKKMFDDQVKDTVELFKTSQNSGNPMTSARVSVNAGRSAVNAARDASNDNFATAARNVINYKRSGGNLSTLRSVGSYRTDKELLAEFGKRRK